MLSLQNISHLCRCCFVKVEYKSELSSFQEILKETFNIYMAPIPEDTDNYNVCSVCGPRLQDAATFRKQILSCEEQLSQYIYSGYLEIKVESDIKEEQEIAKDPSEDLYSSDDEQPLSAIKDTDDDCPPHNKEDEDNETKEISINNCCTVCDKQFLSKDSLEVHMKIHTGEKSFPCLLCNITHTDNKSLTTHMTTTHMANGKYPCNTCKQTFDKVEFLIKHIKLHKSKLTNSKIFPLKRNFKKLNTDVRNRVCNICNQKFSNKKMLDLHMFSHTGEKSYICDICGMRYLHRSDIQRHISRIHMRVKAYSCNVCQKKFIFSRELINHERQHTGERPYKCDMCGKGFATHRSIRNHMKTHIGNKPFACNMCNRKFMAMHILKRHQRSHTDERPFSCSVCMKKFKREHYVKVHMKIHSEEKPFACEVCNKTFRGINALKRHMQVHTSIKKYTCKICNKHIAYDLARHMRTHTNEKPVSCTLCDKKFAVKDNLKLHMRIHTGEKPYTCEVCGKSFTQSCRLPRHKCVPIKIDIKADKC